MKLNFVLLATSILQFHAKEMKMGTDCYSKVDCKALEIMQDAMDSGKLSGCSGKTVLEDATRCMFKALGMNKDQIDLAWKITPIVKKCSPEPDTEFKTCVVGCTKQTDRDACLEDCALSFKIKGEECLEKSAGMSTENASKNVKCMMGCDKDTYADIFECQYECRKDVIDALAGKSSSQKSSSSGSQSSNPGKSSAYLTTQANSLAKITLSILIASLFI